MRLGLVKKIILTALVMAFVFFSFSFLSFAINRWLYPLKYKEIVFEMADNYRLDRALVFATIKEESSFDKDALSSRGAVGLMQLTKSTADYIASKLGVKEYNLTDEKTNISFGCFYLRYLLDKFFVIETAVVAYNAGEGRVREWLNDKKSSDDGKTLKYIPYIESREYLKKIVKTFEKYKKLYGNILDKS